jgi:uncharacterized RDD family membrane protein YckC
MMNNSGFWPRALAVLIDTTIFVLVFLYIGYSLINSSHSVAEFVSTLINDLALIIFPLAIYNLFHRSIFTYLFGGTPGKLLTGLAVTGVDNEKLSFKRILFRQLIGYQLSAVALGLGFFSVLRDSEKRGWHDKASGTKVITRATLWPVGLLALAALIYGNYLVAAMTIQSFKSNTLLKTDAAVLISQYEQEKLKEKLNESSKVEDLSLQGADVATKQGNEKEYSEKYDAALAKFDNKDYQGAYDASTALLKDSKTDEQLGWTNYLIADSAYELYEDKDAQNHIALALTYMPDQPDFNNLAAQIYIAQESDQLALAHAQKAVALRPDDAWFHSTLGLALYYNNQNTEGLKEMQKAIDLDPSNTVYQQNLEDMKAKRI